jgi:excisionase family DNA binding protein
MTKHVNMIPMIEPRPPGVARLAPFNEALRYGRLGKTRAYELIHAGKIKAVKDGRRTLVDLNTIDEYQRTLPAK